MAKPNSGKSPKYKMGDLILIRGMTTGVVGRLRLLGVTTYEQIARWTPEEADRVCRSLMLPGANERYNWIEQAQWLAEGRSTVYARNVLSGRIDPA